MRARDHSAKCVDDPPARNVPALLEAYAARDLIFFCYVPPRQLPLDKVRGCRALMLF
jgi:hypothetical protein